MGRELVAIFLILFIMLAFAVLGQKTADEWLDAALELTQRAKYNEAIRALDKAIQMDFGDEAARFHEGNTLKYLGNYDKGIQAYDGATS